jgi:MFS family permease
MAEVSAAAHAESAAAFRPLAWLKEGTPAARRALLGASLGWMLDAFDVMLYALVVSALLSDLSITTTVAGFLGSLTLLASGFGGILFGIVADRVGRRRALMSSIVIYSIFTAACGLAQSVWQLGVFRLLLGLGMGGEWTSGAAIVSETWPDEHRGKAVALMQSAWAVGYALAAVVVALVLPRFGWRVVFLIGIAPALLTLWIRRGVPESEVWLRSRARPRREFGAAAVFRPPFRRMTALLTIPERRDVFRVLGIEPVGARVPVAAAGSWRSRVEHVGDDAARGCDAGGDLRWVCVVRLHRGCGRPEAHVRVVPAGRSRVAARL